MRYCVFLLVFCCFGLLYGSLAASQGLDAPVLASQVGVVDPTSIRNNKAAKHSPIADSVHYLKSRMFGASTVQTLPSESVGDLPLQPSVPHQIASSSDNRISSLRKAAQEKGAPLPLVSKRNLAVGPMPADMYQPPNVEPRIPVPAPVSLSITRRTESPIPVLAITRFTEPPLPDHCATAPQKMSCPPSSACQGKNLMFKQGRGTCEVACVLECYVDLKRKLGWACGSCSS
jgi:hypothetical protein